MTTTPPPGEATNPTPLYDQTISAPTYRDLRSPEPGLEDDVDLRDGAAGDSGSSGAKEKAKQTTGAAKDAASSVASDAKDAGRKVAGTGKEQAGKVAKDAIGQARQLYGEATSQLSEQAGKQQQKAGGTLRTFGDDLRSMGEHADGGLASELVQNLAGRAGSAARFLEDRSPEDVLREVRRFAARRPGLFILLAAGTGVVAARLSKALIAEAKDDHEGAAADGGHIGVGTTPGATGERPIQPAPELAGTGRATLSDPVTPVAGR